MGLEIHKDEIIHPYNTHWTKLKVEIICTFRYEKNTIFRKFVQCMQKMIETKDADVQISDMANDSDMVFPSW